MQNLFSMVSAKNFQTSVNKWVTEQAAPKASQESSIWKEWLLALSWGFSISSMMHMTRTMNTVIKEMADRNEIP